MCVLKLVCKVFVTQNIYVLGKISLLAFLSSAVTIFAFFSIGPYSFFCCGYVWTLFSWMFLFLLCSFNYDNSKTKSSSLLGRLHRVRFRDTFVSTLETFVRHSPTRMGPQPFQHRPAKCRQAKNRRRSGSNFNKHFIPTVLSSSKPIFQKEKKLSTVKWTSLISNSCLRQCSWNELQISGGGQSLRTERFVVLWKNTDDGRSCCQLVGFFAA